MKHRDSYWCRLDNAAKLFPAVSTGLATNVFRLTARLKEDIQKELLQKAVEISLEEMPAFKIKLHKGLFWYYFEHNPNKPHVKEEFAYPCRKIDRYTNNSYLFEVTYFEKNINCEVFHALSDGTGAVKFLRLIVEHYLILAHPEQNLKIENDKTVCSDIARSEDSFVRISSDKTIKSESMVRSASYSIDSLSSTNSEVRVIKGIMSTSQVKNAAKEKGVTISVFITALLIYSIYLESFRYHPVDKPISICIPVNLRRFFPSQTQRNFFTTVPVGVNFYKKDYSLDEVIRLTAEGFEEQLCEQSLLAKVKYGVSIQNKIYLRFTPLFLKNLGLKIAFAKGEKGFTSVVSNLGAVTLSKGFEDYVERFELLLSPTKSNSYKTSACSFGDKFVYAFTVNVEDTDIQKRFFSLLVDSHIDVTISCNEYSFNNSKEDKD